MDPSEKQGFRINYCAPSTGAASTYVLWSCVLLMINTPCEDTPPKSSIHNKGQPRLHRDYYWQHYLTAKCLEN